jgi:hypothetical protein
MVTHPESFTSVLDIALHYIIALIKTSTDLSLFNLAIKTLDFLCEDMTSEEREIYYGDMQMKKEYIDDLIIIHLDKTSTLLYSEIEEIVQAR